MNAAFITAIISLIGVAVMFLADTMEKECHTFGTKKDVDGLFIIKGIILLIPVAIAALRMEALYLVAVPAMFAGKVILTAIFKKAI